MITRVPLHIREGLGSHKLHYTGGKLGPNTLHTSVPFLDKKINGAIVNIVSRKH